MKQRTPSGNEQTSPLRKRKQNSTTQSPPSIPDAITRDFHTVNDTLSRFVGGKQKAWMLGGGSGASNGVSFGSAPAPGRRPPNTTPRPRLSTQRPSETPSLPSVTTAPASSFPAISVPAPASSPSCPPPERVEPPPPPPVSTSRLPSRPSRSPPLQIFQESGYPFPSPAPSHSPPGMEHRQLGQPVDCETPCSLPTPRESVSGPSISMDDPSAPRRSNPITLATLMAASNAARSGITTEEARKRSRDETINDTETGSNKRPMTAPPLPPSAPPTPVPQSSRTDRPTLNTQPTLLPQSQTPPTLLPQSQTQPPLQPHQIRHIPPQHIQSSNLPANQSAAPQQASPSGYAPYNNPAPIGFHGLVSPGAQSPFGAMASPLPPNTNSPAHSLPPSPGPSPVQQNFSRTTALVPYIQLMNALTTFAAQFNGDPIRQLTHGDHTRLNVLREAVKKEDWHFLVCHQLYIARTMLPSEVNTWTGFDMTGDHTHEGWSSLQHYVGSNNDLSGACLAFMVSFPLALQTSYLRHPLILTIVPRFQVFLTAGHQSLTEIRKLALQHLRAPEAKKVKSSLDFPSPTLINLVIQKLRDEVRLLSTNRIQQHAQQQQQYQQYQQHLQQQTPQSIVHPSPNNGYFNGMFVTLNTNQQPNSSPYIQTHQSTPSTPSMDFFQPQAQQLTYPTVGPVPVYVPTGVNTRAQRTSVQTAAVPSSAQPQHQARRSIHEQLPFGLINQAPRTPPIRPSPVTHTQQLRPPPLQIAHPQSPQPTGPNQVMPGPIQENILQSRLMSPIMVPASPVAARQLHIFLVSFAVKGFKVSNLVETTTFEVSQKSIGLLSRVNNHRPGEPPTRPMVVPGNLIYRLRCVQVNPNQPAPTNDSDWVVKDCYWPPSLFVSINNQRLEFRRKSQWGKDLPVDITNFLRPGPNELRAAKVQIPESHPPGKEPKYYITVEIFQASDEAVMKSELINKSYLPALSAHSRIMSRLTSCASADDDDLVVASSNILISLLCPLSFGLISIPVRGKSCTHIDCFDYDNFMKSRPKKRPGEPPLPESYRCPHCKSDVRPSEMIVDGWIWERLQEARKEKGVKGVIVEMDGKWRFKIEEEGDDSDDEKELEKKKITMAKPKKPVPEIICIDDD